MRITLPPPPRDRLQRLETAAAARPGLYRAKLVLLAVAGDVLLTFVRMTPVAGPIVVGALFVNNAYVHLLTAVVVLMLAWLMRPDVRDRGRSVARHEAPELYSALDVLKMAVDAGGRIEVRLDDEFNASAREARGLFGIAGTRRVLTLGVPLLMLLGRDEARAIIAHEFGHFSRRHGRFGHWLYWAHYDWLAYATQIDSDGDSSLLERGSAVLAHIFAPAFSRRAMVWSRRCEYEADADAARAAGTQPMTGALARLAVFEAWRAIEFPRILRDWRRDEPVPPEDFLERLITAFDAAPSDLLVAIMAREAGRPGDWSDTHPVLAERAFALGLAPELIPRGAPAGPTLLGAFWASAVADWNARWRREHAVTWPAAHARYRLIEAPLLAASPESVAGWPLAQRFDRARALRRYQPERGLAALEALHAEAPGDRRITFAWASVQLAEGDTVAVKILSALAKEDAGWREPVYARLARHCEVSGDRTGARRWGRGLHLAHDLMKSSRRSAAENLMAGKLSATTRPATFVATVHAGLAADPTVATAWLVEGTVPLPGTQTERPATLQVDTLIITVHPFDARQQPCDTDAIKHRHAQILGDLVEPDALVTVALFYTTELLPAVLAAALVP
jgi:Zn-dependent protease with chaperone function